VTGPKEFEGLTLASAPWLAHIVESPITVLTFEREFHEAADNAARSRWVLVTKGEQEISPQSLGWLLLALVEAHRY